MCLLLRIQAAPANFAVAVVLAAGAGLRAFGAGRDVILAQLSTQIASRHR